MFFFTRCRGDTPNAFMNRTRSSMTWVFVILSKVNQTPCFCILDKISCIVVARGAVTPLHIMQTHVKVFWSVVRYFSPPPPKKTLRTVSPFSTYCETNHFRYTTKQKHYTPPQTNVTKMKINHVSFAPLTFSPSLFSQTKILQNNTA